MRIRKNYVFRARVDERHFTKIANLMATTGYTPSQLLRTLIESAAVQQTPKLSAELPMKCESAESYQGQGAFVGVNQ